MFEQKRLEYEFVEFFGVLPKEDEYSGVTYYEVSRNGLTLSFVIPFEANTAEIFIQQEASKSALLTVRFYVLGNINFRKHERSDILEFQKCILISSGSPITERNEVFDSLMFPNKVDLELSINPEISLRFF